MEHMESTQMLSILEDWEEHLCHIVTHVLHMGLGTVIFVGRLHLKQWLKICDATSTISGGFHEMFMSSRWDIIALENNFQVTRIWETPLSALLFARWWYLEDGKNTSHRGFGFVTHIAFRTHEIFGRCFDKCSKWPCCNHWFIAFLYLTNKYVQCILYALKTLCEKQNGEYTKLKLSELMNIQHLNYTYVNVMQQPDQSSCGLFTIAYVVDIAFNIYVQKSNYITNEMRQHLNFLKNMKYITSFSKIPWTYIKHWISILWQTMIQFQHNNKLLIN